MGKASTVVNLVVGLMPLFIVLPIIGFSSLDNFLPGVGVVLAVATMLAGFAAFAIAKFSRFRSGRWLSFGVRGMPSCARRFYVAGLAAVGFGAIGSIAAVLLLPTPW
jgi:hypothetical protein